MISRICIQETQKFAASCGMNDLVNARQSKRVLGASLIQVGVVNTHPPSSVFLQHKNWIGQPFGMKNFGNEPVYKDSGYLLSNSFASLVVKTTEELLDRLHLWINI